MKAFKEYLVENKKVYQYRIKLANCDLDGAMLDRLERNLAQFQLVDITKPKSLPIAKTVEFAKLGPVERKFLDITVNYPTTREGLRMVVHAAIGCPLDHIIVVTTLEDEMEKDPVSQHEDGPVLGNKEYPDVKGAQDTVGLKKIESLLKELGKDKHAGEQYKGINDAILASKVLAEKPAKTTNDLPQGNNAPVGSVKNKLQPPRTGSKI